MRFFNIKKTLKNCEPYLISGKYYFNKNYSQLIKENISNEVDDILNNQRLNKKEKFMNILYKLSFGKMINVKNGAKKFDGNILLFSSTGKTFKVFSDNQILTYFFDNNDRNEIIKNRNIASNYFIVPNIYNSDVNYIIEEKIESVDYDKEDFLINILNAYSHSKNEILNSTITHKHRFSKLFSNFYSNFKDISSRVCMYQHGDLWKGNVLYDGNDYNIIDYENYNNRYFLYDFFFYMYSFVFINNDFELLDNYFNAKYDQYLKLYFENIGLKYDENSKGYYFKEFILNFIEERYFYYNIKIFYNESKKVTNILKKYNLI